MTTSHKKAPEGATSGAFALCTTWILYPFLATASITYADSNFKYSHSSGFYPFIVEAMLSCYNFYATTPRQVEKGGVRQ